MIATDGGATMRAIDAELARDPQFRRRVEALMEQMKIEQDLVALREARGVSQVRLAGILGVSQPFVAKLESGKASNVELRTLVRWAAALGARVRITVEPTSRRKTKRAKKTAAA
jgi:predicted XRE-type DNA-binding protein